MAEIVPRVADPPAVVFTAHVTLVFELPETVALNWKESPARILAVDGVTVTVVEVGVVGPDGVDGLLLEVVVPLQPLSSRIAKIGSNFVVGRMARAHTPVVLGRDYFRMSKAREATGPKGRRRTRTLVSYWGLPGGWARERVE